MITTYTDEYLEHFGARYVEQRLKAHGVTFLQYLARPQAYEQLAMEPEPLLPRQQRVAALITDAEAQAARVEKPVDHLPRRNGRIIEPLHHHAHPRSGTRDFLPMQDISGKPESEEQP